MIWDDVRKQSPRLRDPSIQVVRVPFRILGDCKTEKEFRDPSYDGVMSRANDDLDTILNLIPRNKDSSPDLSWVKYPFETFVIVSTDDRDWCCLVVQSRVVDGSLEDWVCEAFLIAGRTRFTVLSCDSFYVEDGRLHSTPTFNTHAQKEIESRGFCERYGLPWIFERSTIERNEQEWSDRAGGEYLPAICLATMALMSTKNITKVLCQPPRQQRRHAERKGLLPPVSWHELVIHPMGQKESHKGTGQCESLALHWVRGHWKDYRATGLFGRERSKGMYWWSPHLAGQADRVVFKDYKLETA